MAEMENPVRRTRADYEKLLAEYGASGLSLRAFAESKGIKPGTLYAWHRRLRPRVTRQKQKKSTLVPVRLVGGVEEAAPTQPVTTARSFEVTIPGERVVSVPIGFDAEELRRLLAVLDAAC